MSYKLQKIIALLLCVFVVCFIGYGLINDCKDTAGYVDCSTIED